MATDPADTRSDFGSAAEMARAADYATLLVRRLRDDPRVRRAYSEWREAHGLVGAFARDEASVKAAIFREPDRDLQRLARLVSDELRLPYTWLNYLLLIDFVAQFADEIAGTTLPQPEVTAPDVPTMARGRRRTGDYRARYVEWLYLVEIAESETMYGLAKAYAADRDVNRRPSTGYVEAGIKEAKRLLAMFDGAGYPVI